jgi:hypothetical protein
VKKFAPADADPREVSAMFFGIASSYLAATVDAATNGADMPEISGALGLDEVASGHMEQPQVNRTAVITGDSNKGWDPKTGRHMRRG